MKVLLLNGSPKEKGCTYTALCEVEKSLNANSIETEIIHIGKGAISGCTACGGCRNAGKTVCVINTDGVNDFIAKAAKADGFVVGSPVHYAGASGGITSFLDRAFYAASKDTFAYKPGAALVTLRRGGATAALEQLNKYFTISNMPLVSSQYWNMAHGNTPEELVQDLEGMQILRTLGHNMAWLLRCLQAGKQAGVAIPTPEAGQRTNFIR